MLRAERGDVPETLFKLRFYFAPAGLKNGVVILTPGDARLYWYARPTAFIVHKTFFKLG